jgi:SAM-dependent methyltransferase
MVTNSIMKTDAFFREYTSQDAILKYSRATAGCGISYLLDHDYKAVYLEALQSLPATLRREGIHILEFGCGAGMNLLHLASMLSREGINVASAVGTDFSPVLIEAAVQETQNYLRTEARRKVQFCVARNETLIDDLSSALGKDSHELKASFHFILGVNTMRYCHRAGKQTDCAHDIFDLLVPGGVSVVIDMNNRFPAFRSALKNRLQARKQNEGECYLPTLEEYTEPFRKTGFEVLRREHFCWIPHSAGQVMTGLLGFLSPVLNMLVKSRAMRSLVVSRKPGKDR